MSNIMEVPQGSLSTHNEGVDEFRDFDPNDARVAGGCGVRSRCQGSPIHCNYIVVSSQTQINYDNKGKLGFVNIYLNLYL
jgi:hypothetical protein